MHERIATGQLELDDEEAAVLASTWEFWARPSQLAPDWPWTYWFVMAGRGFGKTRIGAEWTRESATDGVFRYVNLIGPTADDARDIMIEGESGLLEICPSWERPVYRPSKRRLDWPNGCVSLIFTADEPERLRGKQHERFWADEVASWRYPEAWDQALLGLRLGPDPRAVVTSTPKPVRLVRELLADPKTAITKGSTYENRENLAPVFFETIVAKYEGTRLGRQELEAELLEEIEGALWTRRQLDALRTQKAPEAFQRIVVAVDPNTSTSQSANEAGVIVAGAGATGPTGILDKHAYVLADKTTLGGPHKWARAAVDAYYGFRADAVVAEQNNGGEMVRITIHTVDPNVPVKLVHASRGKRVRAEPVAALYEQGKVHHVGTLTDLEDQMCTWTPDSPESPDRMDALVWGISDLLLEQHEMGVHRYAPERGAEPVVKRGDLTLVGERYVDR